MGFFTRNVYAIVVIFMMVGLTIFICGCNKNVKEKSTSPVAETGSKLYKTPDIEARLAKYAPIDIEFDDSILSDQQKQVLNKFVEAAKLIDKIFWKQASFIGLNLKESLGQSGDPADANYLHYLKINYGPYDRLDENKPFIGSQNKPAGAAFYPKDLTKKEFQDFLSAHPDLRTAFESPYTVIRRGDGMLTAIPYNVEYQSELRQVAKLLKEAADITGNASLKKYLQQRSKDLLNNDYFHSDCDWIDLDGNLVEIVIGPFEVYEDGLLGMKAAYESFVYVNDMEEMKKLKGYIGYLDKMQQNLPVETKYKSQKVAGLKSPLNVVFEVYCAGDTRSGVQTLAFVLPNDERVREEKGSKKVMLKNIIEAKYKTTLMPIAEKILMNKDLANVSFYAYFNETILHELCHALGLNYTIHEGEKRTTVNRALKELYSPIEEAKATILGLYSVPLLIDKGWIPAEKEAEFHSTHLAGMFRSLRFGLHEAHGLGTLLQLNYLREKGGFIFNNDSEKFEVNPDRIRGAIRALARELLMLEGDGNYDRVKEFLGKYGRIDDIIENSVKKLADIPTDIEPIFEFDK